MCIEVDENVVNIDYNIFYFFHNFFHHALNKAEKPNSFIGLVTHLKCPWPGNVNAVLWVSFGWSGICLNPDVISIWRKLLNLHFQFHQCTCWFLSLNIYQFSSGCWVLWNIEQYGLFRHAKNRGTVQRIWLSNKSNFQVLLQ